MALFFTADTHLGHANIIRHCERPFASVQEMDEAILKEINAKVCEADTLYVLGDFAHRGRSRRHYRSLIRCKDVRLLLGNHDHRTRSEAAGFQTIKDVDEITVDGRRIWMSHYAHRSWPASHRGSWHLYGHSHGMLDGADVTGEVNALDVGVDNCSGYGLRFGEPWSLDDVGRVLPRTCRK